MTIEKVGDLLLNMNFDLLNNSCNNIPKCVMGCYTLTLTKALKQFGTSPTPPFFFAISQFDWPKAKKKLKLWKLPKIEKSMKTWSASPVGPPI
jgi:hypothetical protein